MTKHLWLTLVTSFMLFATPLALAEEMPPANAISMSALLQNLQTKGYVSVLKVEFEDGIYEAKVTNTHGKMTLYIDPQTGEFIDAYQRSLAKVSALQVVKNIEQAGYKNVYKIERMGNKYLVKAFDKDGQKVEVMVDAKTGKLAETWVDQLAR